MSKTWQWVDQGLGFIIYCGAWSSLLQNKVVLVLMLAAVIVSCSYARHFSLAVSFVTHNLIAKQNNPKPVTHWAILYTDHGKGWKSPGLSGAAMAIFHQLLRSAYKTTYLACQISAFKFAHHCKSPVKSANQVLAILSGDFWKWQKQTRQNENGLYVVWEWNLCAKSPDWCKKIA